MKDAVTSSLGDKTSRIASSPLITFNIPVGEVTVTSEKCPLTQDKKCTVALIPPERDWVGDSGSYFYC